MRACELLEELAALAAEKVRGEGLRLMGDGGLLPELAQHLMQAALEAEMDEHLAAEAGRTGGRGSRSGGNMRNGYRAKKVMTEVGAVTVQVLRDRLGTFRPRMLPAYARRTGALDDLVLSLTAKGLTSGEIVSHLAQTYGMTTTAEPGPLVTRGCCSICPPRSGSPGRHRGRRCTPPRRPRCEGGARGDARRGDAVLLRTGHVRRRTERGPWDSGALGAGFHVDSCSSWRR